MRIYVWMFGVSLTGYCSHVPTSISQTRTPRLPVLEIPAKLRLRLWNFCTFSFFALLASLLQYMFCTSCPADNAGWCALRPDEFRAEVLRFSFVESSRDKNRWCNVWISKLRWVHWKNRKEGLLALYISGFLIFLGVFWDQQYLAVFRNMRRKTPPLLRPVDDKYNRISKLRTSQPFFFVLAAWEAAEETYVRMERRADNAYCKVTHYK